MFDAERSALLESGRGIFIGSRDARMRPDITRGFAVKVLTPRTVRLWVIPSQAEQLFSNLDDNGAASVVFTRVTDYDSIQLKGRSIARHGVDQADRAFVEAQQAAFRRAVIAVGYPESLLTGMRSWPCASFDVEGAELFCQTPGPRAGTPL